MGSDFYPPISSESTFVASSNIDDFYCFTFTIVDDLCAEDDEYFSVHLQTSDNDVIIHIAYASVHIVDHDCKCNTSIPNHVWILIYKTLWFVDIMFDFLYDSYTVEEGADNITVCVEISKGCLERYAIIGYSTVDGTAQCKCKHIMM